MTIYLVYSFYPKINHAKKIAELVLQKKLYIWKNKMCDENEIELSFKTNDKKVKRLISFLELNHPYDCPAILAFPIKKTNDKFLKWVKKQIS